MSLKTFSNVVVDFRQEIISRIFSSQCADGNKRVSDLSVDTLLEVCRGEEGEMALGKHAACPQAHTAGCGGVDYILHIVLEVIIHILPFVFRLFSHTAEKLRLYEL
jgi:hypothetical protein